jgi:hypothetical protein
MALSRSLDRFLTEMEYPATRDDLLREAARDGIGAEDYMLLQKLPEQNYGAAWQLRMKLTQRPLADATTPALALAHG